MDDSEREILFDERPTQVTEVTRTCSPFGIPSMRNWPQRKMIWLSQKPFRKVFKIQKFFYRCLPSQPSPEEKKKRFEVRRRNKNETGLLPQSQARELFVIRVRGNHSLRWTTQREKFFSTRDQRKSQKLHERAVLLEYHLCGTDHRGRWSIKSKTIS